MDRPRLGAGEPSDEFIPSVWLAMENDGRRENSGRAVDLSEKVELSRSDPQALSMSATRFHLHLVSDSTGETVHSVARACLVQFEEAVRFGRRIERIQMC